MVVANGYWNAERLQIGVRSSAKCMKSFVNLVSWNAERCLARQPPIER